MSQSPFLNDPREELAQRIAAAVASPIEEVRAIHLRAAEHLAEIAKASGLPPRRNGGRRAPEPGATDRVTYRPARS